MRAEAAQRLNDAQGLRREAAGSASDRELQALDDAIDGLRELTAGAIYDDPEALARLQQDVVAGMARFEYGLRRAVLGAETERVFLPGTAEVPSQFRKMVDAYFRSLARDPKK
jgi:hypothetical protein